MSESKDVVIDYERHKEPFTPFLDFWEITRKVAYLLGYTVYDLAKYGVYEPLKEYGLDPIKDKIQSKMVSGIESLEDRSD